MKKRLAVVQRGIRIPYISLKFTWCLESITSSAVHPQGRQTQTEVEDFLYFKTSSFLCLLEFENGRIEELQESNIISAMLMEMNLYDKNLQLFYRHAQKNS